MSKPLFGLTLEDVRVLKDLVRWWRGRGGSRRPVPTRRRTRGGGGGGSTLRWGRLINTVPKNSILEDECVEREELSNGEFAFVMDDSEPPEKVVVWAMNPSLNSAIRGSVDHPLRVFGEMISVTRTEGEETTTHSVFMIMGHQDPLVAAEGFVLEPDNDKGQALIHFDGDAATVADGGPCGGE